MGVTYKLRDEVVHFIISQRQDNPLYSCRQLAEAASQKFGLHLSKSSVHDVLKESGIATARGRKPKDKFEIPQEKKKQIQSSLCQVKLLTGPKVPDPVPVIPAQAGIFIHTVKDSGLRRNDEQLGVSVNTTTLNIIKDSTPMAGPATYSGAGNIFLKAVLWDLGIYSEENIKAGDWDYYLTYGKGVKVFLENGKDFFIGLALPIERCIREVADGLVNNINPFIVHKVSDEALLKATMKAEQGPKINNIVIVDENDHVIIEFMNIVEKERIFLVENRIFVECKERYVSKRLTSIFFPQLINNDEVIEEILNLDGFDTVKEGSIDISLLVKGSYDKNMLQQAMETLNGMCLRDENDKLVKISLIFS